jgi:hypothetical protein
MSDNEPRIIEEIDSHPSAGGGAAISNSVAVVSGLDALTQSVERLVQTMSADVVFDEDVLLEDGEIFDPSLSISGENNSNENKTEKDAIVALPDDDLFNNLEECSDEISASFATRIDSACTKKPAKEKLLKIQERYLCPKNCSFLLAPKVNPELWDDLSDNAPGQELGLQSLQKLFVKSFIHLFDWQISRFRPNLLVQKVSPLQMFIRNY